MKPISSLKKNSDFRKVYNRGKSIANKNLVMYILKNGTDKNRLGISVSKKVGNSVTRNKITRLIKENMRLIKSDIKNGFDIVIIGRNNINGISFYEMKSSSIHLLKKHKIYK